MCAQARTGAAPAPAVAQRPVRPDELSHMGRKLVELLQVVGTEAPIQAGAVLGGQPTTTGNPRSSGLPARS